MIENLLTKRKRKTCFISINFFDVFWGLTMQGNGEIIISSKNDDAYKRSPFSVPKKWMKINHIFVFDFPIVSKIYEL